MVGGSGCGQINLARPTWKLRGFNYVYFFHLEIEVRSVEVHWVVRKGSSK